MKKKTVLVASPVRQSPDILAAFLDGLAQLEQSTVTISYLFVDDNEDDRAGELLRQFAADPAHAAEIMTGPSETSVYQRDEYTHYWREETVWKVAAMKDAIIEKALRDKVDYLFLVDSDLVLHPHTIEQLAKAKKEIVSAIFWTRWQPNTMEMPQVWVSDQYTMYRKHRQETITDDEAAQRTWEFLGQLRIPGVYEVGGLGACTLLSRKALKTGVRFAEIANLSFWGEDRHFCIRAQALGLQLYVDTHVPAYHIYRQADLVGVDEYNRKARLTASETRQISISLCMIVRNEEQALPACLDSAAGIADEIVIVDTGSTDNTKTVVARYTDRIYDFSWIDDFAAARNFAFAQATCDYILWLDADDTFTAKDRVLFLELIHTLDPGIDRVTMPYHLAFDDNGNVTHSLRRNRLVRRVCGFQWIGAVHEYLAASGSVHHSEVAVTHKKDKAYTDRNLRIYRKKAERGEVFGARDLFYFANELREHGFYEEAVQYYSQFLEDGTGWVEDQIRACFHLSVCYGHLCEREAELTSLFRAFEFDLPRADCCCRIGAMMLERADYDHAIYWYDLATRTAPPTEAMGMTDHAAWTWLPHLQLCLCYDRKGQREQAKLHNDKALSYHPTHPSMLHNKRFFEEAGVL